MDHWMIPVKSIIIANQQLTIKKQETTDSSKSFPKSLEVMDLKYLPGTSLSILLFLIGKGFNSKHKIVAALAETGLEEVILES